MTAVISGCAARDSSVRSQGDDTNKTAQLLQEQASERADISTLITGVPFYPQEKYMCGPSAIRSLLNFYGSNIGEAEAVEAVYSERIKGALMMDLLILAKSKGFKASFYDGSITDLKAHLDSGTPLLLLLDMGLKWLPMGHYIVAIGYDDARGVIIAHSGKERSKAITIKQLSKAWKKTGYSTLLITPGTTEGTNK